MVALRFVGSSLDDMADFPAETKRAAGHELWQAQLGLNRPTVGRAFHWCRRKGNACMCSANGALFT